MVSFIFSQCNLALYVALALGLVAIVHCSNTGFTGDIVQYWNTQTAVAINASVPGLASAHASWVMAYVHSSILLAAKSSANESRPVQQLVVSFAAHDTLQSIFLAQYAAFDHAMKDVEDIINPSDGDLEKSRRIGEQAARDYISSRLGDGITRFTRYDYKPPAVGVYQATPPDFPFEPRTPSEPFLRPFGNVGKLEKWPVPPPNPSAPEYEPFLKQVKEKGNRTQSTRTSCETHTAYLFLEGQSTFQPRFVSAIVGDKFRDNILESAKLYAMVGHALGNAAILEYTTKYAYNSWRPVTAIHFNQTFLADGQTLFDPNWTPLADTPIHPEYISGHAIFSSSVGGILKRYLGSDTLDPPVTVTSNVTIDNIGVLNRTYNSISKLVSDCGDSRVFAGLHFKFSCDEAIKAGDVIAQKVFDDFNS